MPKSIGIRLSDEEYQQLSRQPGQTNAGRVRSLLHQKTLAEEIANHLLAQVQEQQLNPQQADLSQHIKRLERQVNVLGRAMGLLLRIHTGNSIKSGAGSQASPETPIMGEKNNEDPQEPHTNSLELFPQHAQKQPAHHEKAGVEKRPPDRKTHLSS